MRPRFWLASSFLTMTACSTGLTSGEQAAHGVEIVATVTRRMASGDSVAIRIANTGDQVAFLSRCGSGPLLLVQQHIGADWTGGVQNFACPVPSAPGPIRLGPTESITVVRVFTEAGRYRFRAPVATTEDLGDATQAVSNAFDVP